MNALTSVTNRRQAMGEFLRSPSRRATAPAFDYSLLTPDQAKIAQEAEASIFYLGQEMRRRVGPLLLTVKKALDHGQFGNWIKAVFGNRERWAQLCMRRAEFCEGKPERISYLQDQTLDLLAATSSPPDVVAAFVARVEGNEDITYKDVKAKIAAAKKAKGCDDSANAAPPRTANVINGPKAGPIIDGVVTVDDGGRIPSDWTRMNFPEHGDLAIRRIHEAAPPEDIIVLTGLLESRFELTLSRLKMPHYYKRPVAD